MNKRVEIKLSEHEVSLKNDLKYLLNHESYWNVMMFCKDGTMAHNRLTAGLIFPQLQDEISVICPDYTMQDITDQINRLLYFGEEVTAPRDKICASHVIDSDVRHFVQDLGFQENELQGKMFANNDLPNQENVDISFDMDIPFEESNKDLSTLDQLCLDLAPFNQKTKERARTEKKKKNSPFDPIQFLNIAKNTPELTLPSPPNLPSIISTMSMTSTQSFELDHFCDKSLRNSFSMETNTKEVPPLPDTSLYADSFLEESSEDIVEDIIQSLLDKINYGGNLTLRTDNLFSPERTDSIDSSCSSMSTPQPSNLIFSTLGSFRQAETEEPIIRLTAYEAQLGFNPSQFSSMEAPTPALFEDYLPPVDDSFEYVEEKPDITRFNIQPVMSNEKNNCSVDIEKMQLNAEDWEVIHMYLEDADKYDIKSINKNRIKRELQLPRRLTEDKLDDPSSNTICRKRPKRLNRCFKCESCMKTDCRKCSHCKDMKKYGGRGTKKQSCVTRPKCLQYLYFEYKNKKRHSSQSPMIAKNSDDMRNTITHERIDQEDESSSTFQKLLSRKERKRKIEQEQEEQEIAEKKKKVREIKERFKKQEEALKEGKSPLLSVLSRDELLFGFHL